MSRYPFKRILFPTDFSPNSTPALAYALDLANTYHAEFHVLHVIEDFLPAVPLDPAGLYGLPPSYEEQIRGGVEKEFASLRGPKTEKLHCVHEMKNGSPFVEIIRYVRANEIDVIVMGTHGRTGLAHVLMGSVAERVVRSAPCPILVVPSTEHKFAAL